MKFKTLFGLMASGQLSLLFRLNSAFRQSYRSNFIAAALSEGIYAQLRDRPASLDQLYQHIIGNRSNNSPSGEDSSKISSKPGSILVSVSESSS